MSPRTGRRPGEQTTRNDILAAARRLFGDHGFSGASIRMIASDANVDPALVLHYFGNKADLFAAVVQMPVTPTGMVAKLTSVPRSQLGEALLKTVIAVWEDPDGLAAWLALLRSAASDLRAARMLREFLANVIFAPIAEVLDSNGGTDLDASYRLSLAASQIVGLGVARYIIRIEPLASASSDELVTTVSPILQRYLTGSLPTPS